MLATMSITISREFYFFFDSDAHRPHEYLKYGNWFLNVNFQLHLTSSCKRNSIDPTAPTEFGIRIYFDANRFNEHGQLKSLNQYIVNRLCIELIVDDFACNRFSNEMPLIWVTVVVWPWPWRTIHEHVILNSMEILRCDQLRPRRRWKINPFFFSLCNTIRCACVTNTGVVVRH